MKTRRPRMLVLQRARDVATVTHPLRLEIIDRLRIDGPDSIAGLARRLDRRPNALTYHVRLLERAGVVVRSGTRAAGRRSEGVYALAAARIALAANARSRPLQAAVTRSAAAILRIAEREIRHAVESGLGRPDRLAGRPLGRRQRAWLTEKDFAAIHRRLEAIDRTLERCNRRRQGRPYALTVVFVPVAERKKV